MPGGGVTGAPARYMGRNSKKVAREKHEGRCVRAGGARCGNKLRAQSRVFLVCMCVFLMGLLVWVKAGGGPPRLHCASDLWPFVTLSEWERGRGRVSGRDFK